MVAVLLCWKLRTRLVLDPFSEHGLLSLEFSTLILWIYPMQDILLLICGLEHSAQVGSSYRWTVLYSPT